MSGTTSKDEKKKKLRVAVIGGGVSGLAAAWHFKVNCQQVVDVVELFESEERLGGHAHTVSVPLLVNDQNHTSDEKKKKKKKSRCIDVDIGFMVYNHENYPNMVEWFQALNDYNSGTTDGGRRRVEEQDSDMSLAISLDAGETLEWNSSNGVWNGLFAKRSQAFSWSYYTFLCDLLRFHQTAARDILTLHDHDPRKHVTTRQYLRNHGYSSAFSSYYLLPMMAALWSASLDDVLQFPVAQLLGFLQNHKMLQLFDRPVWKTVAGRSQQYTNKVHEILLQNDYDDSSGSRSSSRSAVHVGTPVYSVEKLVDESTTYILRGGGGGGGSGGGNIAEDVLGTFDHVVFACHPPTAKLLLERGNHNNKLLLDLLREIQYAPNVVYVHSDPQLMPRRRHAWASWNCMGKSALLQQQTALSSSSSSQHEHKNGDNNRLSKKGESFEGGESGFGNRAATAAAIVKNSSSSSPVKHVHFDAAATRTTEAELEGAQGRMKAVYVTYWLNRLQNLETSQDIFVSLNPHVKPLPHLVHHRLILSHPQFTPQTLTARQALLSASQHQGVDSLWFCGAWTGYGFHEDGCRSGFQVATALSGIPLPWCSAKKQVDEATAASTDKDKDVATAIVNRNGNDNNNILYLDCIESFRTIYLWQFANDSSSTF
jgi:uncharacterized protein